VDWGLSQLALFAAVWTAGAVAFPIAAKLTSTSSKSKRILICALVLAVAFTPSVVIAHGLALAPAVFILAMAPFVPPAGVVYGALFGALPIAIVWLAIAAVWVAAERRPQISD
jgi:hypothetical protein